MDAPADRNRIYVTLNGVGDGNSQIRCRTNLICDRREVKNLINILMRDSGLPFSETHPVLETDMMDGCARATVIGYPMSPKGDSISIRRHSDAPWTLTRLIANGTLDAWTAGMLSFLVENRCSLLICGARGAGKSSLLSALMFEFPISQRILTIQDTLELPDDRMRSLGYKVQSILIDDRNEDSADTRADDALRVSMRLGESAIILGEARGKEMRTLYQSMRVGRGGSSIMGTIHGENSQGVYERAVHDLGIPPESFMATDVIVTMGTCRDRVSDKQSRSITEFVCSTDKNGIFIDMNGDGYIDAPVLRRIMDSSALNGDQISSEIETRALMRSMLAEMSDERYQRPEWLILANEHMRSCISSGITSSEEIAESFRKRITEGSDE